MIINEPITAFTILLGYPKDKDDSFFEELFNFLDECYEEKPDWDAYTDELEVMSDEEKSTLFNDSIKWHVENGDYDTQAPIFDFLVDVLLSEELSAEEELYLNHIITEWEFDFDYYLDERQTMIEAMEKEEAEKEKEEE